MRLHREEVLPRKTYSDITLDDLRKRFGTTLFREAIPILQNVTSVPPTDWLIESLRKSQELMIVSEKSRSEWLVSPILLTVRDLVEK